MNTLVMVHWALIVSGMIYLITRASIMGPIRVTLGLLLAKLPTLRAWTRTLVYCTACTGFWVGMVSGPLWVPLWPFELPLYARCIESGIAAMALGTALAKLWDHSVYFDEAAAWGDPETESAWRSSEPEQTDAQEEEKRDE